MKNVRNWVALAAFALLVVPAMADTIRVNVSKDGTRDWRPWQTVIDGEYLVIGTGGTSGVSALYADIAGAIGEAPENIQINAATLYLRVASTNGSTNSIYVAPAITDWSATSGDAPTAGTRSTGFYGQVTTGYKALDVTDIASAWMDGTQTNYGVVVTSSLLVFTAYSAETYGWTQDYGPYFNVDYTVVPEPMTMGLLLAGSTAILLRKKRI